VDGGVHAEATERGIPVNVADDPRRCTFLAPATVRRGNLVVAVSTGGASPALAARIRERLEGEFGEEYGPVVEMLEGLRGAARLPDDPKERTRLWYRVVDSDVLALGLQGRLDEARRLALGILEGER
ncbi:MAG: bifunctional precorrin-2 dehydrogenase/sirohydrochlorin ferrochelatase, partial [Acidobacteria bacterium]|nr:bifunctional precorrin-2 dehydrogenase/sirohydrochlorin ferrochelatase [Acidobacteriota bacterium]